MTEPATGAGPWPLSGAQRALYLAELVHPGTPMYVITVAVGLAGPLDVPRLHQAVAEVVARHDALRTTVAADPAPPFDPRAWIGAPVVDLPVVDLPAGAEPVRHAQVWADEPFDLAIGPLLRTRLLRTGAEQHLLVVSMHQMVSDGPSLQVFFDDLARAYVGGPELGPRGPGFAEFAARQRARPVDTEALDWWRGRLAGLPTVLRLPTDRPRPTVASPAGGNHRHRLPAAVMTPALRLARELRVTPFVLVFAVYALFCAFLGRVRQVLVGVPVGGRDRVELERVIGFFATTLPVPVQVHPDRGFAELCGAVRSDLLDVLEHQDVTMEQLAQDLVVDRDPAHAPLVQTFFSFEPGPVATAALPGLRATVVDLPPNAAKVDLDVIIFGSPGDGDDVDLTLTYRTDLFEADTVARMATSFERLLAAVVAAPDVPVGRWAESTVDGLPTVAAPAPVTAPPVAPAPDAATLAAVQRELTRIWCDVLGRDDVGPDDNFFDLGGTSFALVTVHTLIGSRTGTTTPLVALLEFPTIAALARHLAGGPRQPPAAPAASASTSTGPTRAARLRDRRNRLQPPPAPRSDP